MISLIKRDEQGAIQRYKADWLLKDSDDEQLVSTITTLKLQLQALVQFGYSSACAFNMDIKITNWCEHSFSLMSNQMKMSTFLHVAAKRDWSQSKVCKLKRSLYALKQASAVRYRTISKMLLKLVLKQCPSNSCIFVRRDKTNISHRLWMTSWVQ